MSTFFKGYAWARLMFTKKAEESVEKFKSILSTVEQYPLYIVADKGNFSFPDPIPCQSIDSILDRDSIPERLKTLTGDMAVSNLQ